MNTLKLQNFYDDNWKLCTKQEDEQWLKLFKVSASKRTCFMRVCNVTNECNYANKEGRYIKRHILYQHHSNIRNISEMQPTESNKENQGT